MRKKKVMAVGREQDLSMALRLVKAGLCVDIVGSRGSGRTRFLADLEQALSDEGWSVVTIRGVASLRQHPLAALHLAGLGPSDSRVANPLRATAEMLARSTKAPKSALFLDDWDDLDESSWGVAESIRRETGLPIVLSRLQGLPARHTPSGLSASTLAPAFVVEMRPLRFDELENAVSAYLGGPVETSTMSRIFAKSGGVIGLALNLVEAASREGRIALVDEEWSATRDLWSPGLRGIVEGYLENLGPEARDALEIIALVGVADVATVRKLIDWPTLELLEERAMVHLVPSATRQLVTVTPPLLVEFFRHEPLVARRIRLTELITARLGSTDSLTALFEELESGNPTLAEADALFVRLLQERARTRRIVSHAEWERNPSPSTVVDYVNTLILSPSSQAAVEHAFATTDPTIGDPLSQARYASLRARWRAYADGDLEAALAELRVHSARLADYGRLLDATEVMLLSNFRKIPEDFAERLEVTDELSEPVKIALLEAQLFVLACLGRFADAQRVFRRLERLDKGGSAQARALYGLALLTEGRGDAALAWCLRGLDEAHGILDVDGTRAFGAVVVLCYLLAGDYQPAERLINTLLAAGEHSPFSAWLHLGLLNSAAVVAIRAGSVALGARYAEEVAALDRPDSPLPTQNKAWAQAQLLAFNGDREKAADLLWASSEDLWERGGRLSAAMGMLSAVEVSPNQDRFAVAVERAEELGGGLLLSHVQYLRALAAADPSAMADAVPLLSAAGRAGLAVAAYRHIAQWSRAAGDLQRAEGAEAEVNTYLSVFDGRQIDTARFGSSSISLTDREREVAQLVSDGLSNPEIATRLVLSVRTVESHMHRIMRKLELSNRQELKRYVDTHPNVS
ncbi:LuxR family transcriptional regulator [Agromyces sp. S2-1-8]|uniref:LuxR family transcriptional regulator n=1 Tax=Agromyces sp. S2-1-8 TaxID=2897180 RepID=UPI001E430E96|nr:LuxR family transcriptional regulator [Agromyces sp. S2-1-8]MCD5348407.1 LuxR C-terminal-related transcriptional regulator [Agromyces sp. S2-1-8]